MEQGHTRLSRRLWLKTGLAAAALKGFPLAASGFGGRALVCIYLSGGNDSSNLIVPLPSYDAYAAVRGPLAIPKESLIPVTSGLDQVQYGFHPSLPEVASLFQGGALAVVGNVGGTLAPSAPDPYLDYFPNGYATPGWAAKLAQVTVGDRKSLFVDFPNLHTTDNPTSSLSLVAPGITATDRLRKAVDEASRRSDHSPVEFPQTCLGQQLRQVSALIASAGALGMDQQIFLVSAGGFSSASAEAGSFRELSSAMGAFHSALISMGKTQSVTAYTDTEFSKALKPNAIGLLAPAWGAHQLVMGGGVLGGNVHGQFPFPSVGGAHDPRQIGILLPSTTREQYYASLGNWLGVPSFEMAQYLPGLNSSLRKTAGFMVTG